MKRMKYDALVYQPMLEVLVYLRDNGFKTYITSGGGISFMGPWAPRALGLCQLLQRHPHALVPR